MKIWRVSRGAERPDALRGGSGRSGSVCDAGALLPLRKDAALHRDHHREKDCQGVCGKHGFQSLSAGKGVQILREAGIEVETGILAEECGS